MVKLKTVKIVSGSNKSMRVGSELLGNLAGSRKLRFIIRYQEKPKALYLIAKDHPPGWPVIYFSAQNKSPFVRLVPFMKLYGLHESQIPEGEFPAEIKDGQIVVNLRRNGHVRNTRRRGATSSSRKVSNCRV